MGHSVGQPSAPHFDPHPKIKNCNKKALKTQGFQGFLELLPRFELGTSSLPTDWENEISCVRTLLCPFPSGDPCSPALLYPLFPPARFPVWVSVWVNLRNPICQRHQNIFIIFPIQATRDMSTKDFLLFRSDSAWLNTANGFPWKSKSEKSPLLHPFTITNAASKNRRGVLTQRLSS